MPGSTLPSGSRRAVVVEQFFREVAEKVVAQHQRDPAQQVDPHVFAPENVVDIGSLTVQLLGQPHGRMSLQEKAFLDFCSYLHVFVLVRNNPTAKLMIKKRIKLI